MKIKFISRRDSVRPAAAARFNRTRRRKGLLIERLEERQLLAIDSGLGATTHSRFDVNQDGKVTALDALTIINDLNRNGVQSVSSAGSKSTSGSISPAVASSGGSAAPSTSDTSNPLVRLDVNGDGKVSAADALSVIHELDDPSVPLVAVQVEVDNLQGDPITQIQQGQDFILKVSIQDLRGNGSGSNGDGAFEAYMNMNFESNLATADGTIDYSQGMFQSGNITDDPTGPGVIEDAGGSSQSTSPTGDNSELVFTLQMTATAPGTLHFISGEASPSNLVDGTGILLYNLDGSVPTDQINYGEADLQVTALPTVSVAPVSMNEGDSGQKNFPFQVTLSGPINQQVTIAYATADESATAGQDYIAASGTLTFAPNQTVQTINVPVLGDKLYENDETFQLNLTPLSGAEPGTDTAEGTILNDDPQPNVTISDVSLPEGNSGPTQFNFAVSLVDGSGNPIASGLPVTVVYSTNDGTATTADGDYDSTSGTLTFAPGDTSKTISVTVHGDTTFEADETFQLNLSNVTNANLAKATGAGTIQNDDAAPTITIADPDPITEPGTGTTPLNFTVTLSQASGLPVTVAYATASNTATSGLDFQPTSGTLTFTPGQTSQTVAVPIDADSIAEQTETFFVNLSQASGATIARQQATGTILDLVVGKEVRVAFSYTNLDGTPLASNQIQAGQPFFVNVSLQDVRSNPTPPANNSGVEQAYIDVTFDPSVLQIVPSAGDPTIPAVNFPGLYNSDEHFGSVDNGTLEDVGAIINPLTPVGQGTEPFLQIEVVGVGTGNPNISGALSSDPNDPILVFGDDNPVAAAAVQFLSDTVNVTPASVITVSPSTLAEGNSGTTNMPFTVQLARQDQSTVTVVYSTADGTATAGQDYVATSGTLTFAPNQTSQTINVPIIGDTLFEADETFTLNLSSPTQAVVAANSAQVTGTILNDDQPPTVSVSSNGSVVDQPNPQPATFTITVSPVSGLPVVVHYATVDGTAKAGVDYQATSNSVTFAPGETTKTVTVPIIHDAANTSSKSFTLQLSSPQMANLGSASATATINALARGSISGYVYSDVNHDGQRDAGDTPLANITVQLTGIDAFGAAVSMTAHTDANGLYSFAGLVPGAYRVDELQPSLLAEGSLTIGSAGAIATATDEFTILVGVGVNATNYNFGEGGLVSTFFNQFNASSLTGHTGP